jgi:hypothetical protein
MTHSLVQVRSAVADYVILLTTLDDISSGVDHTLVIVIKMCVEHIEFVQSAIPHLNVTEGSCCCPFMLGEAPFELGDVGLNLVPYPT